MDTVIQSCIDYRPPTKRYSLQSLSIDTNKTYCDFAFTEPFKLFSKEGVERIRLELMSELIQGHCRFSSERTPLVLRGVAHHSPFIKGLWRSSEMAYTLTDAAGYPLLAHPMDYELAHINLQDEKQTPHGQVDDWHCDSYPFVCVVMLSDCTDMQGGELVVKTGHNEEIPLKFPEAGYAVILQGQHVQHCARRVTNANERITMVTSCIPADVTINELSSLTMSKNYSDVTRLSQEWAMYRLQHLTQKINHFIDANYAPFEIEQALQICQQLLEHLEHTQNQLR